MAPLRLLFLLYVTFLGRSAMADPWGLMMGSSGYLGEIVAGVYYQFNDRHAIDMSFGSFTLGYTRAQFNLGYVFSPFKKTFGDEEFKTSIVDFGFNLSFAIDHDNYFLKSPVQYPEENYYDQTRDRLGLHLGSTLYAFKDQVSIRYFISLLTVGAVAFYNNQEAYNQYLSSGLILKFTL